MWISLRFSLASTILRVSVCLGECVCVCMLVRLYSFVLFCAIYFLFLLRMQFGFSFGYSLFCTRINTQIHVEPQHKMKKNEEGNNN